VSDNLITRAADPMDRIEYDESGPNPCPPLTAAEYAALKKSVEDDGFIPAFPVLISAGPAFLGRIIDGHHRSQVCAELGIQPVVLHHPCATELEFKILQIKANLERRQLSVAQRAMLGVRLKPLYDERAAARQGTRTDLGQDLPQPVVGSEQGESRALAAQAAGVSRETLRQMEAIMSSEQADVLLDGIQQGKSVKSTYASLRPAKEQDALDTSIDNEAAALTEIEEHFTPAPVAADVSRERAAGDAVRLAVELDAHVRRNGLTDQDILEYRSRPHTFTGTARRLADWLDLMASALELNR
jgi:ParB-like chromosome segregation protein Spo0J